MLRAATIFCCFIGFLAVLFIVAGASQSGDVEAKETQFSADGCTTRELALDEGYGVSRKITQRVCGDQN